MSLVGLDVHASQTHAAILDAATGELRGVRLRMAPVEVVEFLQTLPGPVRAVYEAGPTGFGLARARSRARRATGSRPTDAMPSAWPGCSQRASFASRSSRASLTSSFVT
jgi:hypothetical protein